MKSQEKNLQIWSYRLLFLAVIATPLDANFLQADIAGFTVRMYQVLFLITGLLFFAANHQIWFITLKNLPRRIFSLESVYLRVYDYLLMGLFISSIIGGFIYTEDVRYTAFKTLIFGSFLGMYFIVRYAIRDVNHLKAIVKSLLFAHLMILLFGIYQTIAFNLGWEDRYHLMIMEGRVNSLMYEPDWLGVWSATMLGLLLPFFYEYNLYQKRIALYIYLTIFVMLMSISRSGWVAGILIVAIFYFFKFANRNNSIRVWAQKFSLFLVIITLAIGTVQGFGLTPFNLKNRFLSIFTQQEVSQVVIQPEGEKIVISQEEATKIKEIEEQTGEQARISIDGVPDENVTRRINSFWESINLIQRYPIFGVGAGGVEEEFGEGINTSNIFLGVGTKSGIVGMILFIGIIYLLIKQGWFILQFDSIWGWSMLLSATAFLTANMFNDGLLLGFFWVLLAVWSRIPDICIPAEAEESEEK
jgi:O-antigen ligase